MNDHQHMNTLRHGAHEAEKSAGYNLTYLGILILFVLCCIGWFPKATQTVGSMVGDTGQTVLDVTLGKTKKVTTETKVVTIDAKGTRTETITPTTTVVHEGSGLNITYVVVIGLVFIFLYYSSRKNLWHGWFKSLGGHGTGHEDGH